MKYKFVWFVVLVIIVGGAVYFWPKSKSDNQTSSQNNSSNNQNSNQSSNSNKPPLDSSYPEKQPLLVGTLKTSNNQSRGNLMLVTDAKTVYIHTTRDFSGLVGQDVIVTIDGDLTSFTLVDIKAK